MSANSEAQWKQRGERENNERNALRGMIEGASLPQAIASLIVELQQKDGDKKTK